MPDPTEEARGLKPCPFCANTEHNLFMHTKALREGGCISVTKVQCLRCAAEAPLTEWNRRAGQPIIPAGLHPETARLVVDFATALAEKLHRSEQKYGYLTEWLTDDWEADCQRALVKHIAKGDPRDVAAYCAFMWRRGWSTAEHTSRSVYELADAYRAAGHGAIADKIERTAQPQEVTTEMVERLEFDLAYALEEADLKPTDLVTINRAKLKEIARKALTAALQVNPPSPSQGGR